MSGVITFHASIDPLYYANPTIVSPPIKFKRNFDFLLQSYIKYFYSDVKENYDISIGPFFALNFGTGHYSEFHIDLVSSCHCSPQYRHFYFGTHPRHLLSTMSHALKTQSCTEIMEKSKKRNIKGLINEESCPSHA